MFSERCFHNFAAAPTLNPSESYSAMMDSGLQKEGV